MRRQMAPKTKIMAILFKTPRDSARNDAGAAKLPAVMSPLLSKTSEDSDELEVVDSSLMRAVCSDRGSITVGWKKGLIAVVFGEGSSIYYVIVGGGRSS